MQVKLLTKAYQDYQPFLTSQKAERNLYIWESQRIFQENWDREVSDWADMYDKSLQNSHTRRLWKREFYEPKSMLLKLYAVAPGYVRNMFDDLYNEEKSIQGRIDRFVFYCDQLLQEYKEKKPHSIENNHYHDDDYEMVSLYLAFRFPEKYTLYRQQLFIDFLSKMGVVNVPQGNDFERFVKVSRTVYKLMSKEEALIEKHQSRLDPNVHYTETSLLVVFDFMNWVVKGWKNN